MARASRKKSARQLTKAVNDATAAATENVLRLAADADQGPGRAEKAATIARLASMCEEAADHMAKAHTVLFSDKDARDDAIDHLDAALQCLNQLAAEGDRYSAEQEPDAQSA